MIKTIRQGRYLLVLSIILLIWLNAGAASGLSSANYQIERAVLDAGGGERSSPNYSMCDSVGQPSGTAVSASSNYIHTPGFYECNVTIGPPPPPPPPPAIPEPGMLILFGSGLFGLLILMRRKLKKRK
jgi:hypothetical protein